MASQPAPQDSNAAGIDDADCPCPHLPRRKVAAMLTMRHETDGDAPGIDMVLHACFPSAAEARLVSMLRASRNLSVSLVALWSERIIGHVASSPVETDSGGRGLGLAPVAVLPEYRRQGIAGQLVEQAILASQRAGWTWMVVLGDPRYYQRFGFRPASRFQLRSVYGDGDVFQAQELRTGGMPPLGGMVRYREEFDACGC